MSEKIKIDFTSKNIAKKLPNTGKADYLMIFFHGYGADGDNLIGLYNLFEEIIPQTVFLAPNAPAATGIGGFQWFPINTLSNRELETGTTFIAPYVHDFIDQALEFYNIKPENLILAGFSQGAMITLHVGVERKIAPAALISYSGALTAITDIETRICSKPPVFLCHGADDNIVLPDYTLKAADILTSLGFTVDKHIIPNYPHTIPPEGLGASLTFLNTHIKPIAST
jgi:phospholipase/carboxylesterase